MIPQMNPSSILAQGMGQMSQPKGAPPQPQGQGGPDPQTMQILQSLPPQQLMAIIQVVQQQMAAQQQPQAPQGPQQAQQAPPPNLMQQLAGR